MLRCYFAKGILSAAREEYKKVSACLFLSSVTLHSCATQTPYMHYTTHKTFIAHNYCNALFQETYPPVWQFRTVPPPEFRPQELKPEAFVRAHLEEDLMDFDYDGDDY